MPLGILKLYQKMLSAELIGVDVKIGFLPVKEIFGGVYVFDFVDAGFFVGAH
jgi:hypothetical protein